MNNQELEQAVAKRRTFAIISHPDAGKTTITEQLLLFGGVIREAGTVKGRKSGHFAKSDWMEIEKQRGISVTSSVMQFDYQGKRINILDTPGHEDFSEDTYRTLMAVDAAVMVIDSAKGIEAQTKKLFQVVKKRGIPIFTFMNKLDRDGREPLDLIAELEDLLGIVGYAMNWPMGSGKTLLGIYDRVNHRIERYRPESEDQRFAALDDEGHLPDSDPLTKDSSYRECLDDIELLDDAGNQFDEAKILRGDQTPVFFGSALTNFGVETFLNSFVKYAPAPSAKKTVDGAEVAPTTNNFSGFIFKIQANMNPAHRDRIAFVRIVSGEFERGMDVTLNRTGKTIRLANSTEFMADSRETVSNAVAGDIVGLYDTGNFQIGDTIYSGKQQMEFEPLPQFTPELFMRVTPKNVMKQKSFHKGMQQLVQEGAIQLYKTYSTDEYILGAVGQLQFEVFKFRMANEYNSEVEMTPIGSRTARWIDPEQLDEKMSSSRNLLVKDLDGNPLFLFENQFAERWFASKYPDVKLTAKL
ncbi:peptide chain release factor 3 [Lacticaseibacillus songhuajiangensis]|uniref:peptide chain release factor 3 n=1 Tax=Lacticaseibacillus songhuajiangensis TaxID=1296539 RepID=UPI000F788013|nr:peptide chain release factor 3 [Lacticaseibacillus songhuajiangensis]